MKEVRELCSVDLPSLVTELHLRGFDEIKVDSTLKCLAHVYAVQGYASTDAAGVLAEDIINSYDLDVVLAASELFLEKSMVQGREIFRVRWGCEGAAKIMEGELWDHASHRWEEFVSQLDGRYLGFFLPGPGDAARVVTNWKLSRELKWFSVAVPNHGWKILGIMDDLTEVAWKLDLAYGFRPFSPEGVQGLRVLLHDKAYELLAAKRILPPPELLRSIRLWRFFSEYDLNSTDFVALLNDCGLTLEEIVAQVKKFFDLGLTSMYRDGQYPPYFVNDKKKKEFQLAVRGLLRPMAAWLVGGDGAELAITETPPQTVGSPAPPG
jgi:hypothetical protein